MSSRNTDTPHASAVLRAEENRARTFRIIEEALRQSRIYISASNTMALVMVHEEYGRRSRRYYLERRDLRATDHHLRMLVAAGYLTIVWENSPAGRPEHTYSLSRRGKRAVQIAERTLSRLGRPTAVAVA